MRIFAWKVGEKPHTSVCAPSAIHRPSPGGTWRLRGHRAPSGRDALRDTEGLRRHRRATDPPTAPHTAPDRSYPLTERVRLEQTTAVVRSHLPAPAGSSQSTSHKIASGPFWHIPSEGKCPACLGSVSQCAAPSRTRSVLPAVPPHGPGSPCPLSAAMELRAKACAELRPRRRARAGRDGGAAPPCS